MTPTESTPSRLTPIQNEGDLAPWRKAKSLTKCNLYWLPADFPVPSQQRQWLLAFFELFSQALESEKGLQAQLFLQMKAIYPDLLDPFLKTSIEFNPFFGLSRRPLAPMPPLPDMDYVESLQKGNSKFKFGDQMPDYCYWFIRRQQQHQRELFLGFGGLTTLFIKPDSNNKPPPPPSIPPGVQRSPIFAPLLKQWKPEDGMQVAFALQSSFLKKSKELFGVGIEQDPQYSALVYILPLLDSKDLFEQSEEQVTKSFEIFEVYARESATDHGVILGFQGDYENLLISVLRTMRADNLWYPGQRQPNQPS